MTYENPTTTLVNEVSAKQRFKTTDTTKTKQQIFSKEMFSSLLTNFNEKEVYII